MNSRPADSDRRCRSRAAVPFSIAMTRRLLTLIAVSTAALTCASSASAGTTVIVMLGTSSMQLTPSTAPAGDIVFTLRNAGMLSRTATVAGKTSPTVRPGQQVIFKVTLATGGSIPVTSTGAAGSGGRPAHRGALRIGCAGRRGLAPRGGRCDGSHRRGCGPVFLSGRCARGQAIAAGKQRGACDGGRFVYPRRCRAWGDTVAHR